MLRQLLLNYEHNTKKSSTRLTYIMSYDNDLLSSFMSQTHMQTIITITDMNCKQILLYGLKISTFLK